MLVVIFDCKSLLLKAIFFLFFFAGLKRFCWKAQFLHNVHAIACFFIMLSKFFDRPIALKFPSHEIIGKRGGLNLEMVRAILALIFRKKTPLNSLKFSFITDEMNVSFSSEKLTFKKNGQILQNFNSWSNLPSCSRFLFSGIMQSWRFLHKVQLFAQAKHRYWASLLGWSS